MEREHYEDRSKSRLQSIALRTLDNWKPDILLSNPLAEDTK